MISNILVVKTLMMDGGFIFVTAIERERLNSFLVLPNGHEKQRRIVLWRSARLNVSGVFKGEKVDGGTRVILH